MLVLHMFDVLFVFQYPYVPAHITRPKEHKKLYLVQLPEKGTLTGIHSVLSTSHVKCAFCLFLNISVHNWYVQCILW